MLQVFEMEKLMRVAILGALVMLTAVPAASFPQSQPPVYNQSLGVAQKAPNPLRQVCRQSGIARGLRGPDLKAHARACRQEAKLTCKNQAREMGLRGPDRRGFVQQCKSTWHA